jgi:hypothetical protein
VNKNSFIQTLIGGSYFAFKLNELMANRVLTNKTKYHTKGFLEEFKKADGQLDKLFDNNEEYARALSDIFDATIEELASFEIWHFENIRLLLQSYKENPKGAERFVNRTIKSKLDKE